MGKHGTRYRGEERGGLVAMMELYPDGGPTMWAEEATKRHIADGRTMSAKKQFYVDFQRRMREQEEEKAKTETEAPEAECEQMTLAFDNPNSVFSKFIPLDVAVSGAEALLMCAEGGEQFDREKIRDWFSKFYFEIHMVSREASR